MRVREWKMAGEHERTTLLVFGSGPHGRMIAETAEALGYRVTFLDSNEDKRGLHVDGCPIKHVSDVDRDAGEFIVALGNPNVRLMWASSLRSKGLRAAQAIVHPTAYVSPHVVLGEGTVVLPHAVIENGARVERDCLINTSAYVSHDAVLDVGASLGPFAKVAGRSYIGRGAMLGMGAAVGQRVRVGDGCLIGMRALVMRDLPAGTLVFDMPSDNRGEVTEENWSRAF